MKILAIDPGIVNLGMAILEEEKIIHSFSFKNKKEKPQEKIRYIFRVLEQVVKKYSPDILVYEEQVFASKGSYLNQGMTIGRVIGLFYLIADLYGLEIEAFKPHEVKKNVAHNGRASKQDVQRSVLELYPDREFSSDHESDAIAIGICYLLKEKNES